MAYGIEILAINEDLYLSIHAAASSLNKVQSEFIFSTPSNPLKGSLFLHKTLEYKSENVFDWLRTYRTEAKGHRPFIILVVDGRLSSERLQNLFGNTSAKEGLAVFTVAGFDQFINDVVRYCRYYFTRYAIGFVNPEIKSHNDQNRKNCIFHKKINKSEIKDSLDSGHICPDCHRQLKPQLTNEIDSAIKKMLLVVSNQHPYAIILKGGGVKGLAFAGALEQLEKYFSFDTFAGTSAGAIAAVLLGAGYKPNELLKILDEKRFSDFKDASIVGIPWNLLTGLGMYPGNEIEKWISRLLRTKLFEKLTEVRLMDLPTRTVVYASRKVDGTLVFDSQMERKETHASFAARCSMSIPFVFKPKRIDGIRVFDGGLRNNFPLARFINDNKDKPYIGLYLKSNSSKSTNIFCELINTSIDGEEATLVEDNLDKVVVIDTDPISTTDFNLNKKKKKLLVASGRLGALKFIKRNFKDIAVDIVEIKRLETYVRRVRKII